LLLQPAFRGLRFRQHHHPLQQQVLPAALLLPLCSLQRPRNPTALLRRLQQRKLNASRSKRRRRRRLKLLQFSANKNELPPKKLLPLPPPLPPPLSKMQFTRQFPVFSAEIPFSASARDVFARLPALPRLKRCGQCGLLLLLKFLDLYKRLRRRQQQP
jgi:hypothetical protein